MVFCINGEYIRLMPVQNLCDWGCGQECFNVLGIGRSSRIDGW